MLVVSVCFSIRNASAFVMMKYANALYALPLTQAQSLAHTRCQLAVADSMTAIANDESLRKAITPAP